MESEIIEDIYSEDYTEEYSEESQQKSIFLEPQPEDVPAASTILKGRADESVIKIERIQQISGNITYSLDALWEMLVIQKVNHAFEHATEKIHPSVDLYTPPAPKGSPELEIDLTISNKAAMEAAVSLRRIKHCECKPTQKKIGVINKYRTGYDLCPHRPLFQIEPVSMVVKSKRYKLMQFHIRYEYEGQHCLEYEFSMSHGRKVYLCTNVHVLPVEGPAAVYPVAIRCPIPEDSYSTRLQPVCIADADPPLQFLWLCNAYNTAVEYNIECVESWPSLNIKEDSGLVPPLSFHPIVVHFRPYRACQEELILLVYSGDVCVEWLVIGPAPILPALMVPPRQHPRRKQFYRAGTLPTRLPIALSATHIALVAVCHADQDTVLHLENLSDKCIQYDWDKFLMHGVLTAHVEPAGGILAPLRTVTFRARVSSKGPPCVGSVTLALHVLVREPEIVWKQSGWFTITENGYYEPPIPPPQTYYRFNLSLTVSVRVLQCCASVRGLLCFREPECLPAPMPKGNVIQVPLPFAATFGPMARNNSSLKQWNIYLSDINITLLCGFFDRILWDIVSCPMFKKSLLVLSAEDIPEYSQLRTKDDKPKNTLLSIPFMSTAIQEMLYDCLHETFEVCTKPGVKPVYANADETCVASPNSYWASEPSQSSIQDEEEKQEEEEEKQHLILNELQTGSSKELSKKETKKGEKTGRHSIKK